VEGEFPFISETHHVCSSGYCTVNHILRNNLSTGVAITTLIFKMCNATHINGFPKVIECKSADEYALEMEFEEYKTSAMFTRALEGVAGSEDFLEFLRKTRYTGLQVDLGRVLARNELHSRRSATQPRGRVQDWLSGQHSYTGPKIFWVVGVSNALDH